MSCSPAGQFWLGSDMSRKATLLQPGPPQGLVRLNLLLKACLVREIEALRALRLSSFVGHTPTALKRETSCRMGSVASEAHTIESNIADCIGIIVIRE